MKINAVRSVFEKVFGTKAEVLGFSVQSNVPSQPINNQTYIGAKNRVLELQKIDAEKKLRADYYVGIESGLVKLFDKWLLTACTCIMNSEGKEGIGTSPGFELPTKVVDQLLKGEELGNVMDKIMKDNNTKQKGGAIAYFSEGRMSRKMLCEQGLFVALIPFLKKNEYFS